MQKQPTAEKAPALTAEQKIDAAIQAAHTSLVSITLANAGIDAADLTPDLLGRYHAAGWRVVTVTDGILTLSN